MASAEKDPGSAAPGKDDIVADARPYVDDIAEGKIDHVVLDTINAAEGQYSQADYNRVLRKIDFILLPLMWVCYGTQQADKTSVSTQATFGLREDTHLVGQQYSCKQTQTARANNGLRVN